MTLDELRASIDGLRDNLVGLEEEYEKAPVGKKPDTGCTVRIVIYGRNRLRYQEYFAIPFACIVFMILGIPLSVQINPKGKSGNFVLVILVIFIYYIFMAAGEVLGKNGAIPPLSLAVVRKRGSWWIGIIPLPKGREGKTGFYYYDL